MRKTSDYEYEIVDDRDLSDDKFQCDWDRHVYVKVETVDGRAKDRFGIRVNEWRNPSTGDLLSVSIHLGNTEHQFLRPALQTVLGDVIYELYDRDTTVKWDIGMGEL